VGSLRHGRRIDRFRRRMLLSVSLHAHEVNWTLNAPFPFTDTVAMAWTVEAKEPATMAAVVFMVEQLIRVTKSERCREWNKVACLLRQRRSFTELPGCGMLG